MDCLFQTLPSLLGFFGKLLVVPDTFQLLGVPYLAPISFQSPFYILSGNYLNYQHIVLVITNYLKNAIKANIYTLDSFSGI